MTDRQINKWLRRQFSVVCWMLIGYYFLLDLSVVATAAVDSLKQMLWNVAVGDPFSPIDTYALMENGWGYITASCAGLIILYAWKGRDYWREEICAKENKMTFFVFFCALSFCMGSQMVNSLWLGLLELGMNALGTSIMPALESVSGSTATFSMFLYSSMFAPVTEELVFRGYVLRSLRPYGKRFAIVGSAILFGLFHGNLMQTPYAILMGLILGYIACEYSVYWAIGVHMFNNLVLAEGLGRLTQLLPVEVENAVYSILFGVFLLVSVVILIVRRRDIAAYQKSEWIDRRCMKCFVTNLGFAVFTAIMAVSILSWLTY